MKKKCTNCGNIVENNHCHHCNDSSFLEDVVEGAIIGGVLGALFNDSSSSDISSSSSDNSSDFGGFGGSGNFDGGGAGSDW
jgi:hypothetical protein